MQKIFLTCIIFLCNNVLYSSYESRKCAKQWNAYIACIEEHCKLYDPDDLLSYAQCCEDANSDSLKCKDLWVKSYIACWNAKKNDDDIGL